MWRIVEWSTKDARGRIESAESKTGRASDLVFDGAAATVRDLEVGELVHIEVERDEDQLRVRGLWPDDPRFEGFPSQTGEAAQDLNPMVQKKTEAFLSALSLREEYRLESSAGDQVALHGDDPLLFPPPGDAIVVIEALLK